MFNMTNPGNKKACIIKREINADKITPVHLLERGKATALLESAYHETGKGKYSILIMKNAFTLYKKDTGYFLLNPNGGNFNLKTRQKSFLDILTQFREKAPEDPTLYEYPIPLGGIGYLGYEFFDEIENISFTNDENRDLYDSAFIFGRVFCVMDHLHDKALLVAVMYDSETEDVDLEKELDEVESIITHDNGSDVKVKNFNAKITSKDDKEQFQSKVETIKDEIIKGNLLQCVISRRITIESDISAIDAYRNLRMGNPSPYMFYLNFEKFQFFGTSPEVMVRVLKDNKLIVRPIAGTRPRGITMAEDNALEKDMLNDPKERAEHLMLIDLGRNDVGKVAVAGSVKLTDEMITERYSKVMHIVSEVEGMLDSTFNSNDAIRATFPAGTVSGAPKIQAIKTIEELEDTRRGPYAGLVGYFERDGSLDSCIAIRSAVVQDGKIYLQAGAGIVYDSVPEKEFEETQNKMLALLDALNISIGGK